MFMLSATRPMAHSLSDSLHRKPLFIQQALAGLQQLTELNVSENFLNGVLSEHAGKLTKLETINMDINNITVLCQEVRHWTNLKIFTISDNSLSGKYCWYMRMTFVLLLSHGIACCTYIICITGPLTTLLHYRTTSQACRRSARRGAGSTW